jgi:hypothetical protein
LCGGEARGAVSWNSKGSRSQKGDSEQNLPFRKRLRRKLDMVVQEDKLRRIYLLNHEFESRN